MNDKPLPVLYSFRRCPYAIRARMAVLSSGIQVDIQEVSLKDKPVAMLQASAKGTVPVLCVDGDVIDESLDIILWALNRSDPHSWYITSSDSEKAKAMLLIEENDHDFKSWLDKYKYSSRYPEHTAEYYRDHCEIFLQKLDDVLQYEPYLLGSEITFADVAIFPFVRQFSMVDSLWFQQCRYRAVYDWLGVMLRLPLFIRTMEKIAK